MVLQHLRLSAFIQRQLRFNRTLQADIEAAAISEFEVDLGSVITILEDRHLTNYFADKFCTFNHDFSPDYFKQNKAQATTCLATERIRQILITAASHPERVIQLSYPIGLIADNLVIFGCVGTDP